MQDRRSLLRTGALAVATAVGLAGCSGDSGPALTDTATDATTSEATTAPTETSTDAGTQRPERTTTGTTSEAPTTTATPAATVTVAPGGDLQFAPSSVAVAVGERVRWEWAASGHNVTPTSTPEGSSWEGSPGDDLYDEGYSYTHRFETAGTYEYKCQPHGSIGMVGSVTVEEST